MEYSGIRKIEEFTDPRFANAYLDTGRWVYLCSAGGKTEDGEAYCLHALGWLGPDPENPEDDKSENPDLSDLIHGKDVRWL